MALNNKTKAELLEIINHKENEILDLKEELRQLEKCKKYEDAADEIKGMYDNLVNKGFNEGESLDLVHTMITAGYIPDRSRMRQNYYSYR